MTIHPPRPLAALARRCGPALLLAAALGCAHVRADKGPAQPYQPTHASVSRHPLPDWYQDAKFGIIVHYGLYSVPGWAPLFDPSGKVFTPEFFVNNPYAEWYLNSMRIAGSSTAVHHAATYGAAFRYEDFATPFNAAARRWDPEAWSTLFAAAGARYVVLTTKHHDGFLLWPSRRRNPARRDFVAERDIVGDFQASSVRHHLRVGLYYSGGYDWSWPTDSGRPVTDLPTALAKIPQGRDYAEYVTAHWHELLERYHPDLLWNDIALPAKVDKWQLFSDFYNTVPGGVLNNRWAQGLDFTALGQPSDALVDLQLTFDWFDYYSPEYLPHYLQTYHKWEADHAPGYSFAYNQNEYLDPHTLKTADQLICDLADVVSKNGNLLLGVGPKADGSIPPPVRRLLLDLGAWLGRNGEAIYGTRPWLRAEGTAESGAIPTRMTRSAAGEDLYVILTADPGRREVLLDGLTAAAGTRCQVLDGSSPIGVPWRQREHGLAVGLAGAARLPAAHPLVLKLSPASGVRLATGS